MSFFDEFMVGMEQYDPRFPFGTRTSPPPIPIIPTPAKFKEKKRWIFEYDFCYISPDQKIAYYGAVTLQEGSYIWFQALRVYLDKEKRYPVELSLDAMFQNVAYEVEGEQVTLAESLENLEVGEEISWLVYGFYQRPDALGDVLLNLEILVPNSYKDFLSCKIKPTKLKNGSNFKVLFSLKKPAVFPKPPYVTFGIKGKGRRSGTS